MRRPMAADLNQRATPELAADAVVLAANTDVRRIARFLLESSGVRVTITDDGPVAARAMRCGVPQALITDRAVLRQPGIAKLSEIKRHHGVLRIAVIDDPFDGDVARPAGADVLLSWPLACHQLLRCLPKGSAFGRCRGNAVHSSLMRALRGPVEDNRPSQALRQAIDEGSHLSAASTRVRWPGSSSPQSDTQFQPASGVHRWSSPVLDGVSMAAVLLFIAALIVG